MHYHANAKAAILSDGGPVSVLVLLTAVPRDHLWCRRGGFAIRPSYYYLAFHSNRCGHAVKLPALMNPVWQTLQADVFPSAACSPAKLLPPPREVAWQTPQSPRVFAAF